MNLDTEFIRLPLHVDAERLAAEIAQLPESAWRPHPQGFVGNSAIPLVSVGGDPNSDALVGAMRPTPVLASCPYLCQVLDSLKSVIGRTRLMRLDGNAEAQRHCDISYYWFDRARVHVPVVTHPEVTFHCGQRDQHMAAGEAWIFDTWSSHGVTNPRADRRIHLVADTVGSAAFWSMVENGDRVVASNRTQPAQDHQVAFDPDAKPSLRFESWNWPDILPAPQLQRIIDQIQSAMPSGDARAETFHRTLAAFQREWLELWATHGESSQGREEYVAVRDRFATELEARGAGLVLPNGASAQAVVRELLIGPALRRSTPQSTSVNHSLRNPPASNQNASSGSERDRSFDRPIFLVCPPRSGSTLLFETLSQSPDLWTIGGESHRAIENIPELHPASRDYASNSLTAADATSSIVTRLESALWRELRDREQRAPAERSAVRLLEKTPKNSLRVSFLAVAFPDAYFVYLYRDPRETLSSMLDAWRSGKFVTYPDLPGWEGLPWSLLLTPGWRELIGRSLPDIVAHQWVNATNQLLDDLEALPPDSWCVASYDRLLSEPQSEVERICSFVEVDWDRSLQAPLPLSRTTLTSPDPEKWRRNAGELESMLPIVHDVAARARMLFGTPPKTRAVPRSQPVPTAKSSGSTEAQASPDFTSVHTQTFAELLDKLGSTLIVTTYQSGRVILVRSDRGELNTHLRSFPNPMGVAVTPGRLALGTQREIVEFFDMPAVSKQLDPPGKHDAVYVPRASIVTGDVRVHDVAYANGHLVFVNTRFSALCGLDGQHSFVPVWRPPFITELAPEDRCHLNGLCVADGYIRFVTVLGQTNGAGGWRANKAAGGCILEVPSGRVVSEGLSMPHSPRWHDGKLWVLESGKGEVGFVDAATGRVQTLAKLPGFTRGLAFAGPFAFVGLSQVRETSTFSGLPLTETVKERKCGVWVIDIRNGQTVAFLRFEGTVQEIFDVQILNGARFAELIEPTATVLDTTYAMPPTALADVPTHLRAGAA